MFKIVRRVLLLGVAALTVVGLGVTPAAAADGAVLGSLDSVGIAPDGSIRVTGWAVVRSGGPLAVHVYDTGPTRTVGTDLGPTSLRRPDVEAALGGNVTGFGTLTGFDGSVVSAESGEHRICAYAVAGRSVALLGCRGLTTGLAPVGAIDLIPSSIQQGQPIRIRGWAYDPDRSAKWIEIHAYVRVNGELRTAVALSAASDRPDVAAAIPGVGRAHGFDQDVSLSLRTSVPTRPDLDFSSGAHSVCLFAIGIGDGGNTLLGCRDVEVKPSVTANLDSVSATGVGEVTVRGWSFLTQRPAETTSNVLTLTPLSDPNAPQPEGVTFPADQLRPDVGSAFAGVGTRHGFSGVKTSVPPGRYSACVWIGGAPGPFAVTDVQPARICRDVAVPNAFGAIDSVTVAGGPGAYTVTVRGWAIDPTRPSQATDIRVVVGDRSDAVTSAEAVVTTAVDRPDVNAAFAVPGRHGFEIVMPVAQFLHRAPVCAGSAAYPAGNCVAPFATSIAQTR